MDAHDLAAKIELELKSKILPMTKNLLRGRRLDWTREIKTVLGDLGIALQYEVAASGCKKKHVKVNSCTTWFGIN